MKWYYEWKEKAKALKEEKYQEALAIIKMYNELEELKKSTVSAKRKITFKPNFKE
jgi:hypothetical protein